MQSLPASWENLTTAIGGFLSRGGAVSTLLKYWVDRFSDLVNYLSELNAQASASPINKQLAAKGEELYKVEQDLRNLRLGLEKGGTKTDPKVRATLESKINDLEQKKFILEAEIGGLRQQLQAKTQKTKKLPYAPEPTITTTTTTGGGKEKDTHKAAMANIQMMKEDMATERELIDMEYQEVLETLRSGNLTKEELRQAELLAQDWYNQQMSDLRAREVEDMKEKGAEAAREIEQQKADVEEAQKKKLAAKRAELEAYRQAGMLATRLLVDDIKTQSKILAGFEIAESTKEMARFLASKDPSHLVSSLQHALAAKQYLKAAKGGGGGESSKGGGGGRPGPGNYGRDYDQYQRQEKTIGLEVHFHGGVIADDTLEEWMINKFAPVAEKAVGAGKMNVNWTRD
jgi:hypothetical protein